MTATFTKDILAARAAEAEVRMAAEYLADAMKRFHGGDWRIDISHEVGYVLICDRTPDKRAAA